MAIQGSYRINFTDPKNGSFVIEPYTVNGNVTPTSDVLHPKATRANTSLQLPGQYVPNYGELVHEDLVHLLENFSGDTAPENPIEGQTWYDTGDSFAIIDIATGSVTVAGNQSGQFSGFVASGTQLTAWYGPVSVTDNSYLSISFKVTTVLVTGDNNTVATITAVDGSALTLPNTVVGGFITPTTSSRLGRMKVAVKVNNTVTWADLVNVKCSTVAPTPEFLQTGDLWYDLNVSQLKIRVNNNWVSVTGGYLPLTGGTMTGQLNMGTKPVIFSGTVSTATTLTNKAYVDTAIAAAIEPLQTGTELELEDIKDRVDVIEAVLPEKVNKAGDNIRGALTFGPNGTTTSITRGVDMKDNPIVNPSITWNASDYLTATNEARNVVDKNYTALALKQHMLDVAHGGKVFIVEQPDGKGRITDPIFFTNLSDTLLFNVNSTSYGLGVNANSLILYTGNFIGSKFVFKQTGASSSLFEMATDASRAYKSIYLFDGQPQPTFAGAVTAENDETKVATKGHVLSRLNAYTTTNPPIAGSTFSYTVETGPYNLRLQRTGAADIVVDLNHTHKSERIIHDYQVLTNWKSGASDLVGVALGNPAQTTVSNMLSALNLYKAPTSGAKFSDYPVVSMESKVVSINDANSSFDLTGFDPVNLPVGTEIVMMWMDGTPVVNNYVITAMNTVPDGVGGPDKYFYVTSPALPTAHDLVTKPMTCAVPTLANRKQLDSLVNVGSLKYAPLFTQKLTNATSRSYFSKMSESISAKDFGAIGDGVANDTSFFTALEAVVSNIVVQLGGGTYLVNTIPIGNTYVNGFFKYSNTATVVEQRGTTIPADDSAGMISGLDTTGANGAAYSGGANNTPTVPGRSNRNRRVIIASQNSRADFNISACIASIYSWAYGNVSLNAGSRQSVAGCPQAVNIAAEEGQVYGFGGLNANVHFSVADGTKCSNITSRLSYASSARYAGNYNSNSSKAGGGWGAQLTPTFVGGVVTAVTIVSGGTGYDTAHVLTLVARQTQPTTAAVFTFAVDGNGTITSVTVTNGGGGYVASEFNDLRLSYPIESTGECAGNYSTVLCRTHGKGAATIGSSGTNNYGESSVIVGSNASSSTGASYSRQVVLASSTGVANQIGSVVISGTLAESNHLGAVVMGRRVKSAADRTFVMGGSNAGSSSSANRKFQVNMETGTTDTASSVNINQTFTDMAKMFENIEPVAIPVASLVTWEGRKVRLATAGDVEFSAHSRTYAILLGDSAFTWSNRYVTDKFGEKVMHEVWDEDLEAMVMAPKENPDYRPDESQVPRSERRGEWTPVALAGEVHVRVAADVSVDDYVCPGAIPGQGSKSIDRTCMRVMEIRSPYDEVDGYAVALCLVR